MTNLKDLYLTDLDGTLTKKSLVLSHAGHLIEKGLIKDDGSYHAWVQDMKNEKLIVAVAENYRKEITGKALSELNIQEFVSEFVTTKENWYSTLGMLREQKSLGHRVVVITGSSDFLAQELCEYFGFECKATHYKLDGMFLTGEIEGMFADFQKSNYIVENIDLLNYRNVVGLGDTASDIGIFQHCDENILVEPTAHTMEKVLLSGVRIDKIVKA